ncbi:14279_t:CDS:2, partial [Entrophospora sp. SA101]
EGHGYHVSDFLCESIGLLKLSPEVKERINDEKFPTEAFSDTASKDKLKDLSGPTIIELLSTSTSSISEKYKNQFNIANKEVVPDDFTEIQKVVIQWCDKEKLDVVLTTGGTGFGVRDITPEAIQPLLNKTSPGITHLLISSSLQKTPFAALSRPISGIRGETIVITLPGSPKAVKENLEAIINILPHAIDLVKGGTGENVHTKLTGNSGGGHDFTKRQRKSPYPMISVEEALKIIENDVQELSKVVITVPVNENLIGYVFAEDVLANENVPGYRASTVDGYAVIRIYPVVGTSIASGIGSEKLMIKSGQIARITTGGPVPNGANAVVMVEDTSLVKASEDNLTEQSVEIHVQVNEMENIREIGSDTSIGMIVARKGELVSAVGGEIGVLASVGVKEVKVYKKMVFGILSTGNEVIDYKDTNELKYGQIRDSNRPTLLSIAKAIGFEVFDFGIAKLEKTIRTALNQVDILVTTGGVSMGEYDLLKPVLEHSLGATIHFGRLNMKPGKPTTFATLKQPSKKLIFALPGNPVSTTVTFYLFVLPVLKKLSGYEIYKSPIVKVEIRNNIKLDPRPEYHRIIINFDHLNNKLMATSTGNQISSCMMSLKSCNGLLQLPGRTNTQTILEKGTIIDAMLIGQLI